MKAAHDIFAETNPAFCSFVLSGFILAYSSVDPVGPELPVAYLSLPIALSHDLEGSFDGTNKNTGLLEWLERSPQVRVGLADRLNGSMGIVTEAIRLGCFSRVLAVTEDWRIQMGSRKIKKSATRVLHECTVRPVRRAERLGYWFAAAGSTRTVFDIMGLAV